MKTLKITLVLILLIGVFQNLISQQLKTYQGPYKEGDAVYQYSENGDERIYQGNFKYETKNVTVMGQYDKNKKVGRWTITEKFATRVYVSEGYKEIITGNYINDDMDGLWTLNRINEETKKIIINSQAYFKEGYLINEFKYYNSKFTSGIDETELSLTGDFNYKGNFDSIWIANYAKNKIPFKDIRKFKDGVLYFHSIQNISTGEIIKKYYSQGVMNDFSVEDVYNNDIYSSIFGIWQQIKISNSYNFRGNYVYSMESPNRKTRLFRDESGF